MRGILTLSACLPCCMGLMKTQEMVLCGQKQERVSHLGNADPSQDGLCALLSLEKGEMHLVLLEFQIELNHNIIKQQVMTFLRYIVVGQYINTYMNQVDQVLYFHCYCNYDVAFRPKEILGDRVGAFVDLLSLSVFQSLYHFQQCWS